MRGLNSILICWMLLILAGCGISFGDLDPLADEPEPFSEEALTFLVVGDWGRNGWFRQGDVAYQMGRTAEAIGSRFVISTGDNFYTDGVSSMNDGQWRRSYERVYTAPSLQTPWYVVLGNHDYLGSMEAQIEYTDVSERWTMPARYYAVEEQVDDTTSALFVFLDTIPLVRGQSASTPDLDPRWSDPERQYRWLDSTLAASEATWRIVVGHHPVFAASARHNDSPLLRRHLLPILERHGVAAYFSGHVHSLQHLHPEDHTVHHFVSGGGSLAWKVARDSTVEFAAGVAGFAAASLTADALAVRFIDHRGTVGYVTSIPRSEVPAPAPTLIPAADRPATLPANR